jgi:hypothetical protein
MTTSHDDEEDLVAASAFLEHTVVFHRDASPDGCPHYEALIWGASRAV